jgi:hypothetical protein
MVPGLGQLPAPSQVWASVRTPSAHDCPGPHAVVAGAGLAVQTALPVSHVMAPVVHGFIVSQVFPDLHDPHVPL